MPAPATSGTVDSLWFYPVKGLSGQRLDSVRLTPQTGFPLDRFFALARRDGAYAQVRDRPLSSREFHMLTERPRLAGLSTSLDPLTMRFTALVSGHTVLECDLGTEQGAQEVEQLFAAVLDLPDDQEPVLARSVDGRFNQNWTAYLSTGVDGRTPPGVPAEQLLWACHLVNLASVRDLGERAGVQIDPRRFRANIYADLGEPWIEREWVGRELSAGEVGLRVLMHTERCAATEVNVETARRDLPVVRLLQRHAGHTSMGVYTAITSAGVLRCGDNIAAAVSNAPVVGAGDHQP